VDIWLLAVQSLIGLKMNPAGTQILIPSNSLILKRSGGNRFKQWHCCPNWVYWNFIYILLW